MRVRIYNTQKEKQDAFWKRSQVTKNCLCGCGKVFTQSKYLKGYVNGHSQKITRKFMVGDKAPGWKGGLIYKRGYAFVYNPTHPHHDQEYVKRSRLEMEKKLGRYLETSEIVHHINGNKSDDRIENLFLTTKSAHSSYHRSHYRKIK